MKITKAQDLIKHKLCMLYDAEMQIKDALPLMIDNATDSELKKGFEQHLMQTQKQIERLEKTAETMGFELDRKESGAIEGIIEDGEKMVNHIEDEKMKEMAMVGGSQHIKNFEILTYQDIIDLISEEGEEEAAQLLKESLKEEEMMNEKLTKFKNTKMKK